MRVEDVMTSSVESVPPDTSADEAWNLMRLKGIHHLVVTEDRHIAGIVSERDLGGRHGASARAKRTVRDMMTASVITLPPATPVRKAANVMRGRSIGSIVVARAGRPLGVVTTADLLELVGRGAERPVSRGRRWTLKHRAPHRKRARSTGAW